MVWAGQTGKQHILYTDLGRRPIMEEDRALPDPIHRDLCSLSLWQSYYHLGCDLAAGWDSRPSHWQAASACRRTQAPSLAVCLAWKSESGAATGSLLFGVGVTRSDYNHDMSGSFKLTPANSVDSEAARTL